MKAKLDENLGPTIRDIFARRGHECHLVADEGLRGADDDTVLAAATAEGRLLVTMDQDFANVLLHPPERTAGIAILRPLRRASTALLASMVEGLIAALEQGAIHGKLWIVEPSRIREHASEEVEDPS